MTEITLGKNLQLLRNKSGYTQLEVANALNIDRSTYSYYELGKTSPDVKTLVALSKIFAVSIDDLVKEKGNEAMLHDSGLSAYKTATARKKTSNNSHIYDLKKEERQLVAYFRAAGNEEKEKIMDMAREFSIQNK